MEELLDALAGTALAQEMRFSRWGYALVNTGHVLGIALLVGAILPLDLRLLGVWPKLAIEPLARVLVPVAATGLALAMVTGSLLFLADPLDYAGRRLFLIKISLVLAGTLHALFFQLGNGLQANRARLQVAGGFSLIAWLSALVLGRLIAFTDA